MASGGTLATYVSPPIYYLLVFISYSQYENLMDTRIW